MEKSEAFGGRNVYVLWENRQPVEAFSRRYRALKALQQRNHEGGLNYVSKIMLSDVT